MAFALKGSSNWIDDTEDPQQPRIQIAKVSNQYTTDSQMCPVEYLGGKREGGPWSTGLTAPNNKAYLRHLGRRADFAWLVPQTSLMMMGAEMIGADGGEVCTCASL